jgi:hypothetical protein
VGRGNQSLDLIDEVIGNLGGEIWWLPRRSASGDGFS